MGQKFGYLVVHDIPQDLIIDPEVGMHQNIPQTCDFAPLNVWHVTSKLIGYTLCGLTDDLQVTNHRIIGPLVGNEGSAIHPGCVALHLLTARFHIVKI
jgi:hypothetical protein